MLRMVFLLLILANLVFFAWAQGMFGTRDDGREPQRLASQLVPEKLQARVIDPAPSASPAPSESCRLIKGLLQNEAQRVATQAEAKGLRLTMKAGESQPNTYWVHIPSQQNAPAAEKKLAELKKRGVINAFVIQENGADKFAISLGLFNNEQLANDYLQELVRRGVRSARVQIRENLPDKTQMEVRGPPEILAKQLPELLSGQAAATVVDCAEGR